MSMLIGILVGFSLIVGTAAAQPTPDYVKITPPPGMRWKTLDQSGITKDIVFVDKQGDTWLRKSAAATFTASFVLVQLVGDTAGTEQWMDLVETMPRFVGLRPDSDWGNYRVFTGDPVWRNLIIQQHADAKRDAGSKGMLIPSWVIVPVYRSASNPSWLWWSPEQGPFPPDPQLVPFEFRVAQRLRTGTDIPYTVTVLDLFSDPASEITRPGGYELYRNYYPQFNDDGSLSLTLAGDFSFQKDYLLPDGPACTSGLPRFPDGTCGDAATTTPDPGGLPNTGGVGGGQPIVPGSSGTTGQAGGPPVVSPEPTAQPVPPLAALALAPNSCTSTAGALLDLCGEARMRATQVAQTVSLPPMSLHVNPVHGIVHVPDWYWQEGYDGNPRTATRTFSLPWSRPGTPIRDPDTGEIVGRTPGSSGSYTLSITVRYRPGRYRWDFGDGVVLDTGSLGRAYPAVSDVQHAYQWSSIDQPDRQYRYRLFVDWVGDWRVSGDATGNGRVDPRQTSYQAQQEMRDLYQVRCPDTGCVGD
jgi:hypothetical protein